MDDLNRVCVICGNLLDNSEPTVTVQRGIEKIVECSFKREDGIHEKLEGKTSICVHINCRKNYTRPTTVKASITSDQPSTSSIETHTTTLRSTEKKFEFKTNCFLCGEEAVVKLKKPSQRRRTIHNVATLETRQSILTQCEVRQDEWGNKVKNRIINVNDLIAPEARYHGDCYKLFFKVNTEGTHGRPKTEIESVFLDLCANIEHMDDSQFTLKELQDLMTQLCKEKNIDESYSDYYLKKQLLEYFGDRIVVSNLSGKKNVFCLAETAHKLIETWYYEREENPTNERLRIVMAAALIIKEDIQKMTYESNVYPDIEDIKSGNEELVPITLRKFTEVVLSRKSSESSKLNRVGTVINHAIISSVRPRSFISPLQTGLALTLHRMYGSKHLLDLLSSMGICVSYHEASTYLNSLISAGSPEVKDGGFLQHVFDNADVNMRTLDGQNTFHAMGGIQCIAPESVVKTNIQVDRIKHGSFNLNCCATTRVLAYPKKKTSSLNLSVKDFDELKITAEIKPGIDIFPLNLMWMAGLKHQPGWNGFMTILNEGKGQRDLTHIMAVPFINMDPSNMSTVYSALTFAATESRKRSQSCVVTFDQPLYIKASEIVQSADSSSDVSKIIVRLGGFHLLMSFLGSIGRIMEGSGLENLWETVYGQNTVKHMMSGHAYSRSIRAYTCTAAALLTVLKKEYREVSEEVDALEKKYNVLLSHQKDVEEVLSDDDFCKHIAELNSIFERVKSSSRTAKLWINLFQCIDLMLKFIYAERTGNWQLHLKTTIEMLPYFHAAGHLPYAKSAHMYVQEMLNLESKLSKEEYDMFVNKGYFTVSRSGKFWSGIWSDMTIEQSLMRPMKSIGGLTHGRGITDSTLAKWVLGIPYYIKVHEAVEEFLESKITYGEQHVELRPSRRMRDECDIEKFTLWLTQHNPFTKLSGELVSLYSGFISDDNVNCDNAYEIGKTSMQKMKGKTFSELKLKRKDMVVTQASHKSVAIRSKEVAVNPQQLFNRILCVCDSPTKLKLYLGYELASLPPSLFDDFSLRKGTKSSFLKVFTEGITEEVTKEENVSVVIDGGFLLHCVPWQKETTYGDIIKNYCSYVINKYGNEVTVVFDGYPSEATTKGEEQSRRSEKNTSCNIEFDMSTVCITKKEPFLSNKHNKTKLISMLSEELRNSGIYSVISEADADVDIVKCGIEHLTRFSKVIVVGSDTDLLVLLVALTPENKPLIFKKEIFGKNPTVIYYDVQRLISSYKSIRQLLLFAYAVTGCDTTSSFYGLGKTKAVEALKTNPQAKFQAEKFLNENSSFDELLENGEKFILSLYGLSKYTSLNEGRYFKFTSITTKSTLKSNFDIVKLPPTSEAAHQHLLRVYLQVQLWIGNKLQPTDWGWKFETTKENGVTKKILKPVPSTKPFAPDDLLYLLSCTCKTPCGDYCRCRKSGVKCSPMCENCNGLSCLNSTTLDEETDDFFEI